MRFRNRSPRPSRAIDALLRAAAALPWLGTPSIAVAQTMPQESTFRFQYSFYDDWQGGGEDRMSVRAPMLLFNAPVGESTELEFGLVLDTMSGASPLYHDTLSGASGVGIEDERIAGDITITEHFEGMSIGVGATVSSEDDYDSMGGNVAVKLWSDDKNTVLLIGGNGNYDQVGSSNNPELDERKRSYGAIVGITQVLDKNSVLQSNLTGSFEDGFLTDPYKLGDNRPASRERYAWLTRYVRYIEAANAALHLDYRLYRDSWDVLSHMIEASWYQPLDTKESWFLRPRLRYYTQEKAKFFDDRDPIEIVDDRFYTPDQRLAGFGSFGAGLKLTKLIDEDFSMSVGYDLTVQDNGWSIFSKGSPNIERLYLGAFSLAFEKRF